MESLDNQLQTYLLAKSSFAYGSQRQSDFTNYNGNAQKGVTYLANKGRTPIKSGEIFRTENGKFTFLCTYCGIVLEHCDGIMKHINSHFKAEHPLAAPEFVSIGEVKTEPDLETKADGEYIDRAPSKPTIEPAVPKTIPKWLSSIAKLKLPHTTRIVKRTNVASPEFVSIDEGKTKPGLETTTAINRENIGKDRSKPKMEPALPKTITNATTSTTLKWRSSTANSKMAPTKRIFKIVKRTNDLNVAMALLKTETDEATNSADKTMRPPTRTILKLCKREPSTNSIAESKSSPNSNVGKIWTLKRIKPLPQPVSMKKKPAAPIVDLTNDVEVPVTIENDGPTTGIGLQPNVNAKHSNNGKETEIMRNNVLVRLTRRSCYQCEMEPKIYRTADPRQHRCLLCPTWLPNHDEFYSHVKEIHKKDPGYVSCQDFYCYVCKSRYPFRQHLTAHLKSHSETTDEFLCSFCGSSFSTTKKFRAHMEKHSDRKFTCDHCGKAFNRFGTLRRHVLCHSSEETYICKICSKAFRMNRYLRRHMAVHDEPKISCRHCDAKFHFVSVRRAHEQTRHHVV